MDKELVLKFYMDVFQKMGWEGVDYYICDYASPEHFDVDPELKAALLRAREGVNEFLNLLESRIVENGGDPEDYRE